MKNYLVLTDVSCDIDMTALQTYDVKFIPMEYSLKEEMRVCKGKESEELLKEFYNGQRKGELTKTTQISPYNYEEYLTPYLKEGYSLLYLSLSGGLSDTYRSACLAAAALKEKYPEQDILVVDSYAATGGMGVLTERACRNRLNGMTLKQNYEDLVAATKNIKHWFLVQDLMYLKRGGRVGAGTAVIGTMLNIKPILKIDENGKLVTISKKRGNNAAVQELYERFCNTFNDCGDVVYVIDADAKELADTLEQKIKDAYPEVTIKRSMLSPIIGAHTGPGMVAVCHMGKPD